MEGRGLVSKVQRGTKLSPRQRAPPPHAPTEVKGGDYEAVLLRSGHAVSVLVPLSSQLTPYAKMPPEMPSVEPSTM